MDRLLTDCRSLMACRGFESHPFRLPGISMAERPPVKRLVEGSSPSPAVFFKKSKKS